MNSSKKKSLVIVSRTFPPFMVGSSILLANLFESYKGNLQAIACWQYEAKSDSSFKAPCTTYYLKMPFTLLQRVYDRFQHQLIGLSRIYIKRRLKSIQPDLVFLVYPSGPFLVAAYQACKALGIPYMIQMHDLWEENFAEGHVNRALAEKWEKSILKNANKRFSMTKIQQKHYHNKYGFDIELLPHTIKPERISDSLEFLKLRRAELKDQSSNEVTVAYTGNVSHKMNLDAIQQFVKVVDLLPSNFIIKMFVSFTEEQCKKIDIYHNRITYDWLPMDEVQEVMRTADILFLPLSFKNAAMDEVKTVYATKTLDYLISGTPILVYSPDESFHTVSAKEDGWGFVVNEDSPEAIFAGITQLVKDKALASKIVDAAFEEANRRNASKYAQWLLDYVNNN
jgi:glycosyltransferase involved in cell wall biosynthesis